MKRILFTLPFGDGLPIFGYGLMLMLGFVAALLIALRRARKTGIPRDAVMDIGLLSIFAGVAGARLAFLLLDYVPSDGSRYGSLPEWLAVWQGGLTLQGGLALAIVADWLYLRWKKIPLGVMFDVYAPALAVGIGLGRVGCLLNGCCWGKPAPAGFPFAMVFPPDAEPMAVQAAMQHYWPDQWHSLLLRLGYAADTVGPLPLYPTQLVSAIGLFLIALGLIAAERRRRNRPDGQVITWFLLAYSIGRFLVEFWRDDTPLRYGFGAFPGFRLGQWIALVMFAAAVLFQIILNRRARAGGADRAGG